MPHDDDESTRIIQIFNQGICVFSCFFSTEAFSFCIPGEENYEERCQRRNLIKVERNTFIRQVMRTRALKDNGGRWIEREADKGGEEK